MSPGGATGALLPRSLAHVPVLPPTFEHIRTFLAVAEHLHFARAAGALKVSQPTVSQHVQRLELSIGAPLVDRTTRSVALTPAGAALADRMRPVVVAFDKAVSEARPDHGGARPLRIACTPTASTLVPKLQSAVDGLNALPVIDVQWEVDVLSGVRAGRWEFAVAHALPPRADDLHVAHLREEPLRVIASGDRTSARVRLQDLADANLLVPPADLAPYWDERLREILASVTGREPAPTSVPVTNARWLDDLRVSVDAVCTPPGAYTVVPASAVPAHITSNPVLASPTVPLVIVWRKDAVRADTLDAVGAAIDAFGTETART